MGLSPPIDGNEPTEFSFSSAYPSPLPTSPSSPTPLPSSSWRASAQTARVPVSEAVNPPPVPRLQSPQPRSSLRPQTGGKSTEVAQPERGLPPSDTQAGPDTESTKTSAGEDVEPSISGPSSQGVGLGTLELGQRGDSASNATSAPERATKSSPTKQDHTPRAGDSHGPQSIQAGSPGTHAEPPVAMKAPANRKKVPFEKGFSQMDWLRLTQTHPDLAGLRGGSRRRIKMEEVKLHKAEDDSWTVLRGKVFNITPYFNFHPGGKKMLKLAAGKDSTELFNKYHMWVNADFLLEKCWLGIIDNE